MFELLPHKFGVHRAHERTIFSQQVLVDAGTHPHGEFFRVDDGVHADVVEVFSQHIELVECRSTEALAVIAVGADPPQQRAASAGFRGAVLCGLVILGLVDRKVLHWWPTPSSGVDWRAVE